MHICAVLYFFFMWKILKVYFFENNFLVFFSKAFSKFLVSHFFYHHFEISQLQKEQKDLSMTYYLIFLEFNLRKGPYLPRVWISISGNLKIYGRVIQKKKRLYLKEYLLEGK